MSSDSISSWFVYGNTSTIVNNGSRSDIGGARPVIEVAKKNIKY